MSLTKPVELAIGFILLVVSFVIIFGVLPTLWNASSAAAANTNASAVDRLIIPFIPTFLVLGLLVVSVVFIYRGATSK